jgi:hypothetical protein
MFRENDNGPIILDPRTIEYVREDQLDKVREINECVAFNMDDLEKWKDELTDDMIAALILNDPYTIIKYYDEPKEEWQIISISQSPIMVFYIRPSAISDKVLRLALDQLKLKNAYGMSVDWLTHFLKLYPKDFHEEIIDWYVCSIDYYFNNKNKIDAVRSYWTKIHFYLAHSIPEYKISTIEETLYPVLTRGDHKSILDHWIVLEKVGIPFDTQTS